MKIVSTLRTIILESSSFDELYKKYVEPKKDKEGKKVKPLMDLTIFAQVLLADPTTKVPEGFDQSDLSIENVKQIKPGIYRNWLLKNYEKPNLEVLGEPIPEPGSQGYNRAVSEYRRLFIEDLFKVTDDLKTFSKYKQY